MTGLFRTPRLFQSIRERAAPYLRTFPSVKVWIPACATGEEVYATAIVLRETNILARSMLYATDADEAAIQTARQALYPLDAVAASAANYQRAGGKASLDEYYTVEGPQARIRPLDAQNRVHLTFGRHNLDTDSTINEFQLIVCPNRLNLSSGVLSLLHHSLCRSGLLALSVGDHQLVLPKGHYDTFAPDILKKMS